VKHPHDMPPFRFAPSPTFSDSSRRLRAGVANSAHDAPREPSCSPIQPDNAMVHDAKRK
jgi:hypothetical protein